MITPDCNLWYYICTRWMSSILDNILSKTLRLFGLNLESAHIIKSVRPPGHMGNGPLLFFNTKMKRWHPHVRISQDEALASVGVYIYKEDPSSNHTAGIAPQRAILLQYLVARYHPWCVSIRIFKSTLIGLKVLCAVNKRHCAVRAYRYAGYTHSEPNVSNYNMTKHQQSINRANAWFDSYSLLLRRHVEGQMEGTNPINERLKPLDRGTLQGGFGKERNIK